HDHLGLEWDRRWKRVGLSREQHHRRQTHRVAHRGGSDRDGRAGLRSFMRTLFVVILLSIAPVRMAEAQQTITDVLSFLMTNRSIPTDDFVRDEQAAIATSNTIANLFVLDLASVPSSSTAGFTYRLDPALGTPIRTSESFGPIFTQRSLLAGQNHASFGVSYRSTNFTNIDGRSLRDGTLLSTASILRGDT